VEVGQAIPAKLYTAVAEILVLVYRAQAQMRRPQDAKPDSGPSGPAGERQ
jgi:flagellar biosynthesis protein FlhB